MWEVLYCFTYHAPEKSECSGLFSYAVGLFRNILASASADKLVKIWDVATETCNLTLDHHTDKARLNYCVLRNKIYCSCVKFCISSPVNYLVEENQPNYTYRLTEHMMI